MSHTESHYTVEALRALIKAQADDELIRQTALHLARISKSEGRLHSKQADANEVGENTTPPTQQKQSSTQDNAFLNATLIETKPKAEPASNTPTPPKSIIINFRARNLRSSVSIAYPVWKRLTAKHPEENVRNLARQLAAQAPNHRRSQWVTDQLLQWSQTDS